MRLLYYVNERLNFARLAEITITDSETMYIFDKLKSKYKLDYRLEFRNKLGGVCSNHIIRLQHNPSLLYLIHEVAHSIQHKKRRYQDNGKRWHTKQHKKIMRKIEKYALKHLDDWRSKVSEKNKLEHQRYENKIEKEKAKEEYNKTPQFRLEQIQKNIKRWESKLKRAEKALKRLNRRKIIWQRKVLA